MLVWLGKQYLAQSNKAQLQQTPPIEITKFSEAESERPREIARERALRAKDEERYL